MTTETTEPRKKPAVFLDFMEQEKIKHALIEALEIVEDNADRTKRLVRYRLAGQTDKTVSEEIGDVRISESHVRSFRQKYFGALYLRGPTGSNEASKGRDRLHARIVEIERDIADLTEILVRAIGPSHPDYARLVRKSQQGE